MITISQSGDFKKTEQFLLAMKRGDMYSRIESVCQQGVSALAEATPKRTGKTAASWSYEILTKPSGLVIYWKNSNTVRGFNVAMGLQYGHGTRGGTYVSGTDYINPAMKPIFQDIADKVWQEVTKS